MLGPAQTKSHLADYLAPYNKRGPEQKGLFWLIFQLVT